MQTEKPMNPERRDLAGIRLFAILYLCLAFLIVPKGNPSTVFEGITAIGGVIGFLLTLIISIGLFRLSDEIRKFMLFFNSYVIAGLAFRYVMLYKMRLGDFGTVSEQALLDINNKYLPGVILSILMVVILVLSSYFFTRPGIMERFGVKAQADRKSRVNPMSIFWGLIIIIFVLFMARAPTKLGWEIRRLNSSSPKERAEAAQALGKTGKLRVAKHLIASLNDKDSLVRKNALVSLAQLKYPRIIELAAKGLKDKDTDYRLCAIYILGNLKDLRAVELLILALKDEAAVVRSQAARALGNLKDPGAIEPLVQACNDEDATVNANAVWALEQMGEHQRAIVKSLYPAQDDKDKKTVGPEIWLLKSSLDQTKDKKSYDTYTIKTKVLNVDSVSDKVVSWRGQGGGGFSYSCYITIEILEVGRMLEKGDMPWSYKTGDKLKVFVGFPKILSPGDIITGEVKKYQVEDNYTYHLLHSAKIDAGQIP